MFLSHFLLQNHISVANIFSTNTSGVVIMLWKTKLKRVNLMDYLIQEKITTRHTLVKHQSLNEYSHVKRSCFLNAKFFLSSNCYITDHLRLETFVFALVHQLITKKSWLTFAELFWFLRICFCMKLIRKPVSRSLTLLRL